MRKSNGYGSAVQEIAVHVGWEHAAEVGALLGTPPYKECGNPPRSYFLYLRNTTRTSSDEDVVIDLWRDLGDPRDEFDWEIDWKISKY